MPVTTAEITFDSPAYHETLALRYQVLRKPLGLSFSQADLAQEAAEIHLGAFDDQTLIACLVLRPLENGKIKMRQVAVAESLRRTGVGRKLVTASEALARSKSFKLMVLNARDTAVPFYLSMGYQTIGEPFEEVGIPHMKMLKAL